MRNYTIAIVNIINYMQYYITLLEIQSVPRENLRKNALVFRLQHSTGDRDYLLPSHSDSHKYTSNTVKAFLLHIGQQTRWCNPAKERNLVNFRI